MAQRGKRIALLVTGLGLLVVSLAAWSFRGYALDAWYLHEIETAKDETEARRSWEKLRAIARIEKR
jgi:hypothetical protein